MEAHDKFIFLNEHGNRIDQTNEERCEQMDIFHFLPSDSRTLELGVVMVWFLVSLTS